MQAIRLTSEQVTGMPRANTPITTAMHAAEVVGIMLIIAAAALREFRPELLQPFLAMSALAIGLHWLCYAAAKRLAVNDAARRIYLSNFCKSLVAPMLCLAWQPWSKYVAWFCTVLLALLIVRLVRMRAHGGHPRGGKYFLDNF